MQSSQINLKHLKLPSSRGKGRRNRDNVLLLPAEQQSIRYGTHMGLVCQRSADEQQVSGLLKISEITLRQERKKKDLTQVFASYWL